MRTAICPRRVFVGVYQEVVPGDPGIAEILTADPRPDYPLGDHLRVINVRANETHPSTLPHIIQELVSRCMRAERTGVLLGPHSRPVVDWDTFLLDALAVSEDDGGGTAPVVLTSPQPPHLRATATYPTWTQRGPGERPFGSMVPTSVPVIRACVNLCVARRATWQPITGHVQHPMAALALSATLMMTSTHPRPVFRSVSAHRVAWGGRTPDAATAIMGRRALARYAHRVGITMSRGGTGLGQVSGRARLGLSRHPDHEEIITKFGSRTEFERQREPFALK